MLLIFLKCRIVTQKNLIIIVFQLLFSFYASYVQFYVLSLSLSTTTTTTQCKSNLGWRICSFLPVNVQSDATNSVSVFIRFFCNPSDIYSINYCFAESFSSDSFVASDQWCSIAANYRICTVVVGGIALN